MSAIGQGRDLAHAPAHTRSTRSPLHTRWCKNESSARGIRDYPQSEDRFSQSLTRDLRFCLDNQKCAVYKEAPSCSLRGGDFEVLFQPPLTSCYPCWCACSTPNAVASSPLNWQAPPRTAPNPVCDPLQEVSR